MCFESNNDFLLVKIVSREINDDKLCVKTCPLSFEEKSNDETD